MAVDAVEKIRAAENEAKAIKEEAEKNAVLLVAAAKARGEQSVQKAEDDTRAEIAAMRKAIAEKSERLIEKSRTDAQAEAAEIKKVARMRMRAAADEIIRGIEKQCQ